jgi:hypothetical protein
VLYNTTHTNKDADLKINEVIGKAYTFFESIKLKGVGSKRMMVEEVSNDFKNIMNTISDINYGNIELRKKGVLVGQYLITDCIFIKPKGLAYIPKEILFALQIINY